MGPIADRLHRTVTNAERVINQLSPSGHSKREQSEKFSLSVKRKNIFSLRQHGEIWDGLGVGWRGQKGRKWDTSVILSTTLKNKN